MRCTHAIQCMNPSIHSKFECCIDLYTPQSPTLNIVAICPCICSVDVRPFCPICWWMNKREGQIEGGDPFSNHITPYSIIVSHMLFFNSMLLWYYITNAKLNWLSERSSAGECQYTIRNDGCDWRNCSIAYVLHTETNKKKYSLIPMWMQW